MIRAPKDRRCVTASFHIFHISAVSFMRFLSLSCQWQAEIAPFSVETPGGGRDEPLTPNFAGAHKALHSMKHVCHVSMCRHSRHCGARKPNERPSIMDDHVFETQQIQWVAWSCARAVKAVTAWTDSSIFTIQRASPPWHVENPT